MPIVRPPPKISEKTYVTQGLQGLDDQIDLLSGYFKEMQKTTVETAQLDDLISFALCTHYFGVIVLETTTTPVPEEDISDEEAEDAESIFPDDSREATPPEDLARTILGQNTEPERLRKVRSASTARSSDHLYNELSEDEKVLLWRMALRDYMQDVDDDPLARVYHEPGTTPVYDSRGKFPEPDSDFNDQSASQGHYETVGNFINWPDEGPSTSSQTNFRRGVQFQDGSDFAQPQTNVQWNTNGHTSSFEDTARDQLQRDQWMYANMFGPSDPPEEGEVEPIGRELLEPDTTPAPKPVQIEPDPAMQAFMRESALKLQRELREARVKQYLTRQRRLRRNHGGLPTVSAGPKITRRPIGLIYLSTSQTFLDPLHMGECTLGLYIDPVHRGKDCLLSAVDWVIKHAFEDPECHRLQSIIVENPDKLYLLEVLARAGFRNEGIRRRAFFSTKQCEWKDVTYFAMLATDWVYDLNNEQSGVRLRTKSLWDEVFARHQKECDDLIRLEERSTLKRTLSIETIRERVASSLSVSAASAAASEAGDGNETDRASSAHSSISNKRRRTGSRVPSNASTTSQPDRAGSELGSEWDVASSIADSDSVSVPRSATPSVAGYDSGSVSGGSWNFV